jgi:hypothetical protein
VGPTEGGVGGKKSGLDYYLPTDLDYNGYCGSRDGGACVHGHGRH